MDLAQEIDVYIKESIEQSLGLPVSVETLKLKLLASEDDRHRLQDQIFIVQDRLKESQKRVDQYRAEASLNAQGLRKCIEEKEKCIEEKETMAVEYENLLTNCTKLERECMLYERDIEKVMESCDELGKENEELRARLHDESSITALGAEVESLHKDKEHLRINLLKAEEDKEHLRINLLKAEEEVKVLFEENRLLDEENKRLVKQLRRERHRQGSETKLSSCKPSAGASSKGKRKSSLKEGSPIGKVIDFNGLDSPRQPLSPLRHQNSPSPDSSKMHKRSDSLLP